MGQGLIINSILSPNNILYGGIKGIICESALALDIIADGKHKGNLVTYVILEGVKVTHETLKRTLKQFPRITSLKLMDNDIKSVIKSDTQYIKTSNKKRK